MGFFAVRTHQGTPGEVVSSVAPEADAPHWISARFEAVGERLAAGRDTSDACAMVGHRLAGDGADLAQALDGLRTLYARVLGADPPFAAVRALSLAWSEETLGYLHQLSCENPLTGLASLAHLRARITEVYRAAEQTEQAASIGHALVVLELPAATRFPVRKDPFEWTLLLVRCAEIARTVFAGGETISQISPMRMVILAERKNLLAQRVELLGGLVRNVVFGPHPPRIWVEGLPSRDDGAGRLLDELARQ